MWYIYLYTLSIIFSWCQHLTKAVEQKTQSGNLLKMHQEPVPTTPDPTAVNDETSEEPEVESKEYVIYFLNFICYFLMDSFTLLFCNALLKKKKKKISRLSLCFFSLYL